MLPASRLGNTNTFASPLITEPGAFFSATEGTNAASNWNSPSNVTLGANSFAISTAFATFSVSGDFADPFVEKLSIATRGSISNISAVRALSIAISAKSWLSGEILIAQSANTYF
jgi:hypothetical protein